MAASGFTPISLYYSTTASAVPTSGNLANGELGLNIADMKLYAKNSAGVVTLLAASTGATGTVSSVALSGGTTGLTVSGSPITTSGTITLAGTLAIANGGTGQTTANAAFNALVPSQTGNSGKYLTTDGSNTSWGTNPLGTVTSVAASVPSFLSIAGSPITTSGTLAISLSGTALPTTSGGTGLTSFTSGGVVYASSTSALATGSALTFNGSTLRVSAANSSYIAIINGTTKGVRIGADTTGGYVEGVDNTGSASYQPLIVGGSDLRFQTSGTEGMRLTSTGLGIGTSSPATKLQVAGGNIRLDNNQGLEFGGANNYIYGNETTDFIALATNGTEALRINASQNIGLGVTPSTWTNLKVLESGYSSSFGSNIASSVAYVVSNGIFNSGWLYKTTGSASYYRVDGSAGLHAWFNAPSGTAGNPITFTQAMTLDASGNLSFRQASSTTTTVGFQNSAGTQIQRVFYNDSDGSLGVGGGTATAYPLKFFSGNTQAMTLDASGNLGVGTTSPTARLQINGTTDATQRIIVGGTGNTSSYKINYNGSEVGFIQNYQNTEMSIGTTVAASLSFNTNNTQRFIITSAGALGIGATPSYGTSGQVLTSGGSGAAPTWATAGGGSTLDTFTATGTWTKPSGAKMVMVEMLGAGGGGGKGSYGQSTGGKGGGGGVYVVAYYPAADLPSTMTVTIGAGGTGATTDNSAGAAGGSTTWSGTGITTLTAFGGSGGGGATSSSGAGAGNFAAGSGSSGGIGNGTLAASNGVGLGSYGGPLGTTTNPGGAAYFGGAGGGSNTSSSSYATDGGSSYMGGAGGGAGGNDYSGGAETASAGGRSGVVITTLNWGGGIAGGGGTAGTNRGQAGGNGTTQVLGFMAGNGGGGGGGSGGQSFAGGAGGTGGYGSGGGGGGCGTPTSGNGGNGGNGYVRITSW